MDARTVEALNRWFAANALRADIGRIFAIAPLAAIALVVVISWMTAPSNAPDRRAALTIGALAAVGALLLNVGLGHLYYRPRPFLALSVHPLLPQAVDSSLFSDHLAVAGAATVGLLLARRSLGWIALGLTVLLAVGRVGAAVQYPSDCLVGAVVGAACFLVLFPLRGSISRVLAVASPGIGVAEPKPEHAFVHRHRRGIAAALAVVLVGLAYGVRAIQDHGWKTAALRAEAMLRTYSGPV